MLDQDSTLRDLQCWVFNNELFKDNYHSVHCIIYIEVILKNFKSPCIKIPSSIILFDPFHKFQWSYVRPQFSKGVQALHLVVLSSKSEPNHIPCSHILIIFSIGILSSIIFCCPYSNIFTKIKCWLHHSSIWFLGGFPIKYSTLLKKMKVVLMNVLSRVMLAQLDLSEPAR